MEVINNELIWAKAKPDAIIPTKNDEDAGYDFYPCFEEGWLQIPPSSTKLVPTGVACAMTEDYYMQIEERGSTGSKGIKKSAGVIDSSYRGEIFIPISNVNDKALIIIKKNLYDYLIEISRIGQVEFSDKVIIDYIMLKGKDEESDKKVYCLFYPYEKAIAQGVIHRVHKMDEKEVTYEELQTIPSSRGTGALGSSGK